MKKTKKDTKKTTSCFIEREILEHIKLNSKVKNLSEWINDNYPKEFMNLEKETQNLNYLLKEVEKSKSIIKELKKVEESIDIPELAEVWIKCEAQKRIEKATFDGVLRYFNNKFTLDLSRKQFEIIINKLTK